MAFLPSMPDADMKDTLAREPAIGIPFSQLNEAVMRGDAPFSAGERELLAAYVSALNGCDYCQCEHAALAAAFGLPAGILAQLLQDGDTAEVSEAFRAAVLYARKLTLDPTQLGPADVAALFAAGHDERALYFLVFVTAVFTMSTRPRCPKPSAPPWCMPGSSRWTRRGSVSPTSRPSSPRGMMNGPYTFSSS